MQQSKSTSTSPPGEKRGPGFAQIRRGLLAHLPGMSSNAAKLYLWLHLKAFWQGPKRGWVEASFDDMALGNGWSLKTLQRTIDELEAKPYIEVERATNQYELTRVKILKYDLSESTSAVDRFDQSSTVGVDCAVDCGVDRFDHGAVQSKPTSAQSQQDLRAAKKGLEVKKENNEKHDAVRRRFDSERLPSMKRLFSPSEKKKKLTTHLVAKIREQQDTYFDWIEVCEVKGWEHPFGVDEQEAFKALQYEPNLKSPLLSCEFVSVAVQVYEDNREKGLPAGILCSKVIDFCERERKRDRALGLTTGSYYYPPDFVAHRDRVREQERQHVQRESLPNGARA